MNVSAILYLQENVYFVPKKSPAAAGMSDLFQTWL